MCRLLLILLCVACFTLGTADAQTTIYNPTHIQFNSDDHAIVTFYRVEFLANAATPQAITSTDVPVAKVTIASPGPPPWYDIAMTDVPVFLPFGASYLVRVYACMDAACSAPSEVAREMVRYSYCAQSSANGVVPMTIGQTSVPTGTIGRYLNLTLSITSLRPVHAVSVTLIGAPEPAYYLIGADLRGTHTYTVGPLKRTGRFLLKIDAADENGCSASVASQYLTVSR